MSTNARLTAASTPKEVRAFGYETLRMAEEAMVRAAANWRNVGLPWRFPRWLREHRAVGHLLDDVTRRRDALDEWSRTHWLEDLGEGR